ncbi:uncharacterized protein LOC119689290 [Teleopsis dalmanni]|uniref:uncharacterized protein LOC119689290 n=1 Tax=Teleopsis dalmanni TaxID=139649 RepID=UPI0018CE72BE|nr:uncharacterized protein LOC119689290 [Teleopsis dalmanni]
MLRKTPTIFLQIVFVLIFAEFAVGVTITRKVTRIDSDGNKHVWTSTSNDPDDIVGENFRLIPDTVERRFGGSIVPNDENMKEVGVIKRVDSDEVDKLFRPMQTVPSTITYRYFNTRPTFSLSDFDWPSDISTTTRKPNSNWPWPTINQPTPVNTPATPKKSDDEDKVSERRQESNESPETDLTKNWKSNPWLYTPPNYVYTNKNMPKFVDDDPVVTTTPKTNILSTTKKALTLEEFLESEYDTTTKRQEEDFTTNKNDRVSHNRRTTTTTPAPHNTETFMQPVDSSDVLTKTIKVENILPSDTLPIDKPAIGRIPPVRTTTTNHHTMRVYPIYVDPISQFLAKVELSTNDIIAKGGEFSKVISDDNGNVLTVTFLLSSVKKPNENVGRRSNNYQPIK